MPSALNIFWSRRIAKQIHMGKIMVIFSYVASGTIPTREGTKEE